MARSGIKAQEPSGPYPELGRLVRAVAAGLTTREIAAKAPLSQALAWALTDGQRVGDDALLSFARAFGCPLNPLRTAMDLPPYPVDPVTGQPNLTLDFLLPLLSPGVAQRLDLVARCEERQAHDELVDLLDKLLGLGLDAYDELLARPGDQAAPAPPEALDRALEITHQVQRETGAEKVLRSALGEPDGGS